MKIATLKTPRLGNDHLGPIGPLASTLASNHSSIRAMHGAGFVQSWRLKWMVTLLCWWKNESKNLQKTVNVKT